MIPSRLLAFSLLGCVMMLATGCAGRASTAQPLGVSEAIQVTNQTPAPAPSALQETDTTTDDLLDPFARADEGADVEYDPWEPMNLKFFEFNRQFDRFLLKPVARGYNFLLPDWVQLSISNLFYHVRFPSRFLNNVFQGKFRGAGIEVGRFVVNSTIGGAGLIDVAKDMGLQTPEEDTGQTLGFYGVKPGPYLVLPLMPPYTLRDGIGFVIDIFMNPLNWLVAPIIKINNVPSLISHNTEFTITVVQFSVRAGEIVNERSRNYEKFQGVEEATLDLYTSVRNAYLQKRARAIRE